jgi:hypothetical protein
MTKLLVVRVPQAVDGMTGPVVSSLEHLVGPKEDTLNKGWTSGELFSLSLHPEVKISSPIALCVSLAASMYYRAAQSVFHHWLIREIEQLRLQDADEDGLE